MNFAHHTAVPTSDSMLTEVNLWQRLIHENIDGIGQGELERSVLDATWYWRDVSHNPLAGPLRKTRPKKGIIQRKRPTQTLGLPNRHPRSREIPALTGTRCLSRCGDELN